MVVYQLFNRLNGKSYIGQTVQPLHIRWRKHKDAALHGKLPRICKAIRKYGPESFDSQILAVTQTKEELNNLERLWIILLQTTNESFGYNITAGGNTTYIGPIGRAKIARALQGRPLSIEHRQHIGDASRRRWADPTYKTRVSSLISKSLIGRTMSEETKHKQSVTKRGSVLSETHKQHIRESIKHKWAELGYKERLSLAHRIRK